MTEINAEVGEIMKAKREMRGMSRVEMAHKLGVSDVAIYYWETGKNTISIESLQKYCKALDIDMISVLLNLPSYKGKYKLVSTDAERQDFKTLKVNNDETIAEELKSLQNRIGMLEIN